MARIIIEKKDPEELANTLTGKEQQKNDQQAGNLISKAKRSFFGKLRMKFEAKTFSSGLSSEVFCYNGIRTDYTSIDSENQATQDVAEVKENPINTCETDNLREQILVYVNYLNGQVVDAWKSRYVKLWEGILDLDIVAKAVYNPGKQQGTNFNRNLVANIIHYLGNQNQENRRVFKDYNAARYTEKLELNKDHSVRAALGQDPTEEICKALDKYIENFLL